MSTHDPQIELTRILGPTIHTTVSNKEMIKALDKQATQTIRLITRLTNRKGWLKEESTPNLVQAFITSRITYVTPYLNLRKGEKEKKSTI